METRKELQEFIKELLEKINSIYYNGDYETEYFDNIKIKDLEISFYYTNNDKNLEIQILNSGTCIDLNLSEDISVSELYNSVLIVIAENYIDK